MLGKIFYPMPSPIISLLQEASKEFIDSKGEYTGPKMEELLRVMNAVSQSVFGGQFQWNEHNKKQWSDYISLLDDPKLGNYPTTFIVNDDPTDISVRLIFNSPDGHFPNQFWVEPNLRQNEVNAVLMRHGYEM